jgi:hypothetical protein
MWRQIESRNGPRNGLARRHAGQARRDVVALLAMTAIGAPAAGTSSFLSASTR